MSAWVTVLIVVAYFSVGIGAAAALAALGVFAGDDAEALAVCAVLWPMTVVAAVGVLVLALAATVVNGKSRRGKSDEEE